jgi:hypothetical protein
MRLGSQSLNVLGPFRFTVIWPRDYSLLNHQEYVMELVIVSLSIGTLILLATHMIDYAVESALQQERSPTSRRRRAAPANRTKPDPNINTAGGMGTGAMSV